MRLGDDILKESELLASVEASARRGFDAHTAIEMAATITSIAVVTPRLASDEVLKIARLDAERAYRDLSPSRIGIVLEADGWHNDVWHVGIGRLDLTAAIFPTSAPESRWTARSSAAIIP